MSKKYKSKKIIITRQYQILALILVVLAGVLVLLPKQTRSEGVSPLVFVKQAVSSERYISTDQLADRIINQDPTLLLVDTRSKKEYEEFTLPNAINIPLEKFFDEEFNDFLNQDVYDVVLYSNDNFYANEVWMLGNRLDYKNLYVLSGGLNEWFNTIIDPQMPKETDSQKEFELYSFRKAAGMYFGVGVPKTETKAKIKVEKKSTKKVITVKKKKKRVPEGGC